VARLPVEAEGVQTPERERRVADPGIAVVPVPLAAGRLRQRGGRRGDHGTCRRIREALQRQSRALQEMPPRMVREAPARQPVLPVMRGPDQALVRGLVSPGWLRAAPGE